jgi:protein-disulfide isomerase
MRAGLVLALVGPMVGVFAGLLAGPLGGAARADRPSFDPKAVYKVPRGRAPACGPLDAPVTVVAWSDYACDYCYRVQATLDHLARLYPDQLRWVHRTMPLDDDDTLAAEAALAAEAQGRFRPMNERLWATRGRVDRASVELFARELGLDMVRFRADLDARTHRASIEADMADARTLGVFGTPTFFVNGRSIHGNQPLQVFVDVVDQELARAAKRGADYDALVADGKRTADAPGDVTNERRALQRMTLYRMGLGLPGHQSGPDDALVTIVAWGDFECPFCAKQAPVLARLREKYKDDVRVIYRHFALTFHRRAALAAEAAVAAAEQGKFWAFHDRIFTQFGSLERADLELFAKDAGLDLVKFRAALDERRYHDAVIAELASAEAIGVDGTPTMFINGAPVGTALGFESMEPLIKAHLARASELVASGVPRGDLYALLMSAAEGEDRADPSRIPSAAAIRIELRGEDRMRAVAAACRRRDAARATQLAAGLAGSARQRALRVCSAAGIDLPNR